MRMSLSSRREYLPTMVARYKKAKGRSEKTMIVDEVVAVLGYHRKYAIKVLKETKPRRADKRKRKRLSKYFAALPSILLVWRALDYPCAERLHPVLIQTAKLLEKHGEIQLSSDVRQHLTAISRATLARMLKKSRSSKAPRMSQSRKRTLLEKQVPIERYATGELRPGALEADLVEHNGGSSLRHFAYTLSIVDVACLRQTGHRI
ncbi:MAG: hypothetical protein Q8N36_04745 [bacterium]|nr:hypothetical protein [bacterium]